MNGQDIFIQVEMIIKGVIRRYERWNPVRPTIGAFWGVGIGIGCGIGWGPCYGHEVVGNVGAGGGAGFNVGVHFAWYRHWLSSQLLIQYPS
ncbi:hypothetical protein ACS0TY_015629 [Phlomoides rotata]